MSSGELIKQETAVQETEAPANLLDVIARAAADPRVDMDKMERLLAMQERVMADQRKTAFFSALARLQARLEPIGKGGINKHTGSKYARLEDVDRQIKPLLASEGFALSFNEESSDGLMTRFSARLSHKDGHAEEKYMTVPVDAAAKNREGRSTRSAIQDAGSTASYARRYLIKLHLNIVEIDEDNDGQGSSEPISDDQVKDLDVLIKDSRADRAKFLDFMRVERLEDIVRRDYAKAVNALQTKQRRAQ